MPANRVTYCSGYGQQWHASIQIPEGKCCPKCKPGRSKAAKALRAEVVRKLFPGRFPSMSGKMAAIVGCIVGEAYTSPGIAELIITADGGLLARHEDDCGANDFMGSASDLERNWEALIAAAGLNAAERREAGKLYSKVVQDWRKETTA